MWTRHSINSNVHGQECGGASSLSRVTDQHSDEELSEKEKNGEKEQR